MKQFILLLFLITSISGQSQNIFIKTNFGNDAKYFGNQIISDNQKYVAIHNNDYKADKITLWDLDNKVVIYTVEPELSSNKNDNKTHYSSVSFNADSSYLGYFTNSFDDKKGQWFSRYIVLDIQTKKQIKSIELNQVYFGNFITKDIILIKDCGSYYCYDINWFQLNIASEKLEEIKEINSAGNKGLEVLTTFSEPNIRYDLLLDDTSIYLSNTLDKSVFKKIQSPTIFDADKTYLTDINITKDLKHIIFLRPNNSAVLHIESGKVIGDNLPFPVNYNFNDLKYGFNGLIDHKGETFLFINQYIDSTNTLEINSFNFKTKEVKTVSSVIKEDYNIYKFISSSVGELYNFSKIKKKIEFKLTCHALEPQENIFVIYNEYFITAFNNFKVQVFNSETGINKLFEIPDLRKHKNATINVIETINDNLLLAYNYYEENQIKVQLIVLDINLGFVEESLIFNNFYKAVELLVSEDDDKLLISLKNKGIGNTHFLYDLNTFKDITPQLFENSYYNALYLTNDNKYIVGYIKDKGSYVFKNDTKEFVDFYADKMVFIHNKETFLIHLKQQPKKVEIEGFGEVKNTLSGELIVNDNTIKIGDFNASFLNKIDESPININQDGYKITFSNIGYEIFELNLKTSIIKNITQTLFQYPKLKRGNKSQYLVGVKLGENGAQIAVSKSLNSNKYKLLKLPYKGSIYDYNYINNTIIATQNASRVESSSLFSTNFNEEANSYGYENPEKYGTFPFIKFSIPENVYNEKLNSSSQNEFLEAISIIINPKEISKEEKIIFEDVSYDFYNLKTKKRSSFSLEKAFLYLADVPFMGVENNIYVFDKTANKTLELKLFDNNKKLDSKITPWNSLYKWKKENKNKTYTFKETTKEGFINLENYKNPLYNAQLFFNDENDFFISFSDNYYMSNKEFLKYLYFEKDDLIFRPEQFDLKYNRPDIVLERLSFSNPKLIEALKKLYVKRLKKNGVKESNFINTNKLPELTVIDKFDLPTIVSKKSIVIQIAAKDLQTELDSLKIWINDVPIKPLSKTISLINSLEYKENLKLPLAHGTNKIQLSITNKNGLESLKETIVIEFTEGKEKPDLYLISIGVSEYLNEDYNLKYATKDAKDVVNQFLKNDFYQNVYSKILTDREVIKENISSMNKFLKTAEIDDVVIVFIASHGLLDKDYNYYLASHNIDFENPEKNGIPFDLIEKQLENILPIKKIMFIDACHSGEVDVDEVLVKNVKTKKNTKVRGSIPMESKNKSFSEIVSLSKALFSDLRRGNGTTIISSAGGLEFAFEGDEWKNGLFTYCLLNGISSKKADLNADGKIMLSELQNHVYKEVTKLSDGRQTPTSRLENNAIDYRVW
jgi:hypothetical protein